MLQQVKNLFQNQNNNKFKTSLDQCNKIVKYCGHYNVKQSPPYLPDILPEIYHHLLLINSKHGDEVDRVLYFSLFMQNFTRKCERVIALFREGKSEMRDEKSHCRRTFAKISLGLNVMQKELKAIFPEGLYVEDEFQTTKKDAHAFWKNNFGGSTIVEWNEFKNALSRVHPIKLAMEAKSLKKAIDLTTNDHVSVFEFDIFTRLFAPWNTLLVNWNLLAVVHPGHMTFLTYEEVKAHLDKHKKKPGSYIFRLSCSHLGKWAIGYVSQQGEIVQTITENTSLAQHLHEGYLNDLYLYPNGEDSNPDMSGVVNGLMTSNICVSKEQYQQYCKIYSTFEVCKICYDKEKSIRLEPCGHLVCFPCYLKLKRNGYSRCCFCNSEFKEFEKVVVKPYGSNEEEQDCCGPDLLVDLDEPEPGATGHNVHSLTPPAYKNFEQTFDFRQNEDLLQ